jgi:CubicO group peptidase (beta-lactamase class C family)
VGADEHLAPGHVFHFASVSKPFVATAIMQLVERQDMGLDDRVAEILPYFRLADDDYRKITIRQMLDHTSGMPDVEDYEWHNPQFDEGAAERYVRSMACRSLLSAPGSNRQYSNLAFDTLGGVIAKVSGVSFEEYIQSNILQPLGMEDSTFMYPEVAETLRTTGHVGDPARVSEVYPYNRRHAPSSTLNASVAEMTHWMIANLNRGTLNGHRILREESYGFLWTPSTPIPGEEGSVGLSWFLGEHAGTRIVAHGGGDTGFRSHILLAPDLSLGIVLASNWEGTDAGALSIGLLDLVINA